MAEVIIANTIMGFLCYLLFYPMYGEGKFWDYTKWVIPTIIGYYIYYFGAVMGYSMRVPSTHLWYPYGFAGMPSYGMGTVGVKWWNHIDILVSSIMSTLFTNPIFTILFYLSIVYLVIRMQKGKRIIWNYFLVIFAELVMIFTTSW